MISLNIFFYKYHFTHLAAHWDADMPVFEFETPETDLDKNEKDVNSRNL